VVGGAAAAEHEFPWHCALLNSRGKFYGCSATLISCDPVIAVTAAHCIPKITLPLITIKLRTPHTLACGRTKNEDAASALEPAEQRARVARVVTHPGFNGDTFENDIAVISVEQSADFQCVKKKVWPACLPDRARQSYVGWGATTVTGWGRTSEEGEAATTLQKAHIPVVTDTKCRQVMSKLKEAPEVPGEGESCRRSDGAEVRVGPPRQAEWSQ